MIKFLYHNQDDKQGVMMSEEELKKLANNLLLEPNEEVFKLAKELLKSIDNSLSELDQINLDDIKPVSHINETKMSFEQLREDEVNNNTKIEKEKILENAFNHNDNLVIMKRVINEE
ncbi:glutamyl-tRNA amidotransferase [Mycoplasmopsis arginini]|uniref:glutamyl-tRNA amidotransferase n=1 Tax=Mycoplasmopsis arginini TaxID=2094 RepID=UPI002734AD8D|nr:glutamyl-tRNA amidotransferase [Mycoplasmopsis arginini]MDP4042710.1 glutamyl-tRNA amidotransferase [Mycoplasmopsis arginini]